MGGGGGGGGQRKEIRTFLENTLGKATGSTVKHIQHLIVCINTEELVYLLDVWEGRGSLSLNQRKFGCGTPVASQLSSSRCPSTAGRASGWLVKRTSSERRRDSGLRGTLHFITHLPR